MEAIGEHLNGSRKVAMIPFAGVTLDWDHYAELVTDALTPLGVEVIPVHQDPTAIAHSDAVITGGGNTFQLVKEMQVAATETWFSKNWVMGEDCEQCLCGC